MARTMLLTTTPRMRVMLINGEVKNKQPLSDEGESADDGDSDNGKEDDGCPVTWMATGVSSGLPLPFASQMTSPMANTCLAVVASDPSTTILPLAAVATPAEANPNDLVSGSRPT